MLGGSDPFPLGKQRLGLIADGFIAGTVRRTAISLASGIAFALKAISANSRDEPAQDAELHELAVNIQGIIPSFADAAFMVVGSGPARAVRTSQPGVTGPYGSSLLVGSRHEPASVHLLVRALCAGAFTGLAHELRVFDGAAVVRPPLVDLHLDGIDPIKAGESVKVSPAAQSALNQAIGAFIDRGWLPEEAMRELDRIGVQLAVPAAVAAEIFLRGLVNPERVQARGSGSDSLISAHRAASLDSRE